MTARRLARSRRLFGLLSALVALCLVPAAAHALVIPRPVDCVSWGTSPQAAEWPFTMSGNGGLIAFQTYANLGGVDTNNGLDIYVRDRDNYSMWCATLPRAGAAVTSGNSYSPATNDNGTKIAFVTNLDFDPSDVNGKYDIYVLDYNPYGPDTYTRLDVRGDGSGISTLDYDIQGLTLSGDGSKLLFSAYSQLVPGDTDSWADIYAWNMDATGLTCITESLDPTVVWDCLRPSVSDDGQQLVFMAYKNIGGPFLMQSPASSPSPTDIQIGNGVTPPGFGDYQLSGNGAKVVFNTALQLAPGDTNMWSDVYTYTLATDTFSLVSAPRAGGADIDAFDPAITDDGRYVAFLSTKDHVADDTNGLNAHGGLDYYYYDTLTDTFGLAWLGTILGSGPSSAAQHTVMSDDGMTIAFLDEGQLVDTDTNTQADLYVSNVMIGYNRTYSVYENHELVVPAPGVLQNQCMDLRTGQTVSVPGMQLRAIQVWHPTVGTAVLSTDGGFTYTPPTDFVGQTSFRFYINDGMFGWRQVNAYVNVDEEPPPSYVPYPIYRFYNTLTRSHFYTASGEERDAIMRQWSQFVYEGVAFEADSVGDTVPLHRFYNRLTGAHFYTASAEEKSRVESLLGGAFTYEGVVFNVSTTPGPGKSPVHRFYAPTTGTHFYTASETERAAVQANWPGLFTYEGVAYYLTVPAN